MLISIKSASKAFFAFLLAVTLVFAGFQSHANAQSVGANFDIAIDANKTVDQIIGLVTYSQKYVIQVANKTDQTLTRVGAYNDSSNWPVGDVGAFRTAGQQFSGNSVSGSFSFGANYAIGDTGKFVQFAASWPYIGSRKIEIGSINNPGNGPAKALWDKMSNSSDKAENNLPFQSRALMKQKDGSIIWFYEVK